MIAIGAAGELRSLTLDCSLALAILPLRAGDRRGCRASARAGALCA
jgi:hypothetical protein